MYSETSAIFFNLIVLSLFLSALVLYKYYMDGNRKPRVEIYTFCILHVTIVKDRVQENKLVHQIKYFLWSVS